MQRVSQDPKVGLTGLSKEQALLKAIVDTAVDAIITIDERGLILTANPAVQRVFGYEPREVVGKNVSMLMPDPFRSEHDGYLSNYIETGVNKIIGIGREVKGLRRSGAIFPIDLAVSETITERGRIFTGIVRDISERKETEEALRSERALLRAVVETAVDAILTIDEQGSIKTLNSAAERLFGYERDELIGRNVNILMPEPFHTEHDSYLSNYRESGVAKIIGIGREVVGRRKDGLLIPLELAVSESTIEEVTIFTGILRDISERKNSEMEIKHLNEDLERRVAERTSELTRLVEELEGFSYTVAHDLRQPLRVINAMASLVLEDDRRNLGPESIERLASIKHASIKMNHLMDDLLGLARIGRAGVKRQPLDLSAISTIILESLPDPKPQWTVASGLLEEADVELVTMAVRNLIENAWKYRSPERIAVIEIGRVDANTYFIKDNGIGFDMAYASKLFKPFQRLHRDTEYPGTGIGLANVKRAIEKHGGGIAVHSEEGRGTTFYFTLKPRTKPPEQEPGGL